MEDLLNDFKEIRECDYKGEHYSVRDNGAVMRHERSGKRVRKDDNVWTFGARDERTAYMTIGTHRVHIIVATAFLGPQDSKVYVVDHIDTNRCNNRVENLRWFTRLENVLNNPITRRRIEILCGGDIQKFIKDPSCLHASLKSPQTKDLAWMKTVSSEEAKAAYENLMQWAERTSGTVPQKLNGGVKDSEWMYKQKKTSQVKNYWNGRKLDFVLMPKTKGATLVDYFNQLKPSEVFVNVGDWEYRIVDAKISSDGTSIGVALLTTSEIKPFAAFKITLSEVGFAHEFLHTCFELNGALKRMTEAIGDEWTGADSIDDYC
jgi:hypothetical protein